MPGEQQNKDSWRKPGLGWIVFGVLLILYSFVNNELLSSELLSMRYTGQSPLIIELQGLRGAITSATTFLAAMLCFAISYLARLPRR